MPPYQMYIVHVSRTFVPVPRDLPTALGGVLDHGGDGRPAVVGGLGDLRTQPSQPRGRRRESAAGEAPVHAAGVPAAPLGPHPGDDFAEYGVRLKGGPQVA